MKARAPRAMWPVALGILLALPCLAVGWLNDDFLQLSAVVRQARLPSASLWAAYEFARGEAGEAARLVDADAVAWWRSPELKLRFFRPLTSGLLRFDELLSSSPVLAHAHSLLWLLALLLGARALFLRVLGSSTAALALLVHALGTFHGMPTIWLAARHALVGGAFATWSLVLHLRARGEGRAMSPLGMGLLLLGLLSSELALGALAYIVAFELLAADCSSLRERIRRAAPLSLIAVAYLGFYALAGYGARGSGVYSNPLGDPLGFLAEAAKRAPLYAAELGLALPSNLGMQSAAWRVLAAVGPMVLLLHVAILNWLWPLIERAERRALGFLLLGSALALVPGLAAPPGGRVLALVALGPAAALAVMLRALWAQRAAWRGYRRWLALAAGLLLALPAFLIAPLVRVRMALVLRDMSITQSSLPGRAELGCSESARDFVLLSTSDPMMGMYVGAFVNYRYAFGAESYRTLSMAPFDHQLARIDPRTLELTVLHGSLLTTPFELLYRERSRPLPAGSVVELPRLSIRVMEANALGEPTRVRFRAARSWSDKSFCLATYGQRQLSRVMPPAPGSSVTLRYLPVF